MTVYYIFFSSGLPNFNNASGSGGRAAILRQGKSQYNQNLVAAIGAAPKARGRGVGLFCTFTISVGKVVNTIILFFNPLRQNHELEDKVSHSWQVLNRCQQVKI